MRVCRFLQAFPSVASPAIWAAMMNAEMISSHHHHQHQHRRGSDDAVSASASESASASSQYCGNFSGVGSNISALGGGTAAADVLSMIGSEAFSWNMTYPGDDDVPLYQHIDIDDDDGDDEYKPQDMHNDIDDDTSSLQRLRIRCSSCASS